MKKLLAVIFLALAFVLPNAASVQAETYTTTVMNGSIGKYKVVMKLTLNDRTHTITGWYYYKSKGPKNKLQLTGTFDGPIFSAENVNVVERVNGKVTGRFFGWFAIGSMQGHYLDTFSGDFTNSKGTVYNFDISGAY